MPENLSLAKLVVPPAEGRVGGGGARFRMEIGGRSPCSVIYKNSRLSSQFEDSRKPRYAL